MKHSKASENSVSDYIQWKTSKNPAKLGDCDQTKWNEIEPAQENPINPIKPRKKQ